MGALKYLTTLLAALWLGWDLRAVGWNPIAYVRDAPPSDHTSLALLAVAAAAAWLIDRWTSNRDSTGSRLPLHAKLLVGAGCCLSLLLVVANVSQLDGDVLALADLPGHVSFWLLLASVLGTLWVYHQHSTSLAPATTHGTAGWAAATDIKPLATSRRRLPAAGSIYLGSGRRGQEIALPPRLAKQRVLTIGTTGSGKTRSIFMPNPQRQIGLYWQVHEQDVDLLKPLSSLFFTLLLHQLCHGEGELPAPLALLLDEFAQVGRIPKFPNTIAVAAAGERALEDSAEAADRARQALDRGDGEARWAVQAAEDVVDRLTERDGRGLDREPDDDRGR